MPVTSSRPARSTPSPTAPGSSSSSTNPLWATGQGDERWDDRLDDPGPAGRAAELAMLDGWDAELPRLRGSRPPDRGRGHAGPHPRRRRHASGRPTSCGSGRWRPSTSTAVPRRSSASSPGCSARTRLSVSLGSSRAWQPTRPGWTRTSRNIEAGLAAGRTAAAPVVERCITQTRRMLETPAEQSPIVLATRRSIDDATRDALVAAVERNVRPAHRRLAGPARAIRRPRHAQATASAICPTARRSTATTSLPGRRSRRTRAASTTTAWRASPSSRREERRIAAELGYDDIARAAALPGGRPGQPRQPSRAELVGLAEELIARAEAGRRRAGSVGCPATAARCGRGAAHGAGGAAGLLLPAQRGRLAAGASTTSTPSTRPRGRCTGCRPRPSTRRSRATTSRSPSSRSCASCPPSVASARGWRVAPTWRAGRSTRSAWRTRWASTETPRERFGALDSEAWRAARLVVDTGIHALGWTRQQSIDLLRERAGLSQLEAETETDRYISWPGQALAYMIGQREILALRAELERRDGDRFDLRAFHDEVIGHGSLPLSTLRAQLPGWVSRGRLTESAGATAGERGSDPPDGSGSGRHELLERLAQPLDLGGRRCSGRARRGPCRPARRGRASG